MPKNSFLQTISLLSFGIIIVTLLLNKSIFNHYFPHLIVLDFHFLFLSLMFSVSLSSAMYLIVRWDKLIIPGILAKLSQLKFMLFELTTFEKIYISFLAGFSEEILFRGLLQPLLGITIASVVFGAGHCITFGYFLLATGIGFFLGGVFNYSGNIFVPIAVHTLYNIFAFSLLQKIFLEEDETPKKILENDQ